jgi:hypothetical protein
VVEIVLRALADLRQGWPSQQGDRDLLGNTGQVLDVEDRIGSSWATKPVRTSSSSCRRWDGSKSALPGNMSGGKIGTLKKGSSGRYDPSQRLSVQQIPFRE